MKSVSTKDLRKMKLKGFNVVEAKKPEVKSEDKFLLVAQKVIDAIKSSMDVNTRTMAGLVKESQKQDIPIKITPKKEFVLIPERNSEGYIQKITIREI